MKIMFYGNARAEPYTVISDRISDDMPHPNENCEYGYPHSNAILQSRLETA